MSQDLFAAFNEPVSTLHSHISNTGQAAVSNTSTSQPLQLDNVNDEDEDDFGDFEDAQAAVSKELRSGKTASEHVKPQRTGHLPSKPSAPAPRLPFAPKPDNAAGDNTKLGRHPFADHMDMLFSTDDDEYNAGQDEWTDLSNDPVAAMEYSKRVIAEQMAKESQKPDTNSTVKLPFHTNGTAKATTASTTKTRDPNVLFDADDVSEDGEEDEWGDFEETQKSNATPAAAVASVVQPVDLLGLEETQSVPALMRQPVATSQKQQVSADPVDVKTRNAASNHIESNETWDDFDDTVYAAPKAMATAVTPAMKHPIPALKTPPTNVPPPSLLLPFLSLLLKQDPTADKVEDLVNCASVLSHVIAGRKLRWKRSPSLAASMSIGPAGGKSGMKLAGIDRAETSREDREVAEVLLVWRGRIGKLRSAVAAYNTSATNEHRPVLGRVPDLQETMPVRTLKALDGGFTAPYACALCGLRREERLARIDEDVQDSFGEWWLEGPEMHTSCGSWWSKYEANMRSR